jgi:hypothetical protein
MSFLKCLHYGLIICTAAAAVVENPEPGVAVQKRWPSSVDTTVPTNGKMTILMTTRLQGIVTDPDEHLQSRQLLFNPQHHETGPRQQQSPLKRLLLKAEPPNVQSHISPSRPPQTTTKKSGIALQTTAITSASTPGRSSLIYLWLITGSSPFARNTTVRA